MAAARIAFRPIPAASLSVSLSASRAAEAPRGPSDVISGRNGDNKRTGRVSLPLKNRSVASFNEVECCKRLFRRLKADYRTVAVT
jgi:hypothetical protein